MHAVARMLGRIALGYDHDLGTERDTRTAKLLERRTFRREVDVYPDDLSEGPERRVAQYGWETGEPGYDWSDCRHGCNGDCLTGGSDLCTFVCHGGVVDVDHERASAYIALFNEADELVRGYVSDLWAQDWQSPEDSEYDRA